MTWYRRIVSWQIDEFLASLVSAAPNTVAAYGRDLAGFIEWAESVGIPTPTPVDRLVMRRYLAYLATRQYARRSISRKACALRRYFRWLHRRGTISTDPTASLSAPSGEGRLPRVLDHREIHHLLDAPAHGGARRIDAPANAVDDVPSPLEAAFRQRDDAVLEVLYGSGVRVSELCGLDIDSLDLAAGAATVLGKGAKERRVPLSPPAVAALRSWLVAKDADGFEYFSTAVVAASRRETFGGSSIGGRSTRRTPMPCGTPLPPTCSTVEPICGWCKNCWAMRAWRRRSATPM
jgi:integrase/recombinase XerC